MAFPYKLKKVVRESVKLDLPAVLHVVAQHDGLASARLVPLIEETFGCKQRAAQDALGILRSGGWLYQDRDAIDRRQTKYRLTEKGWYGLDSIGEWADMRLSRWRYSTTSSRARRLRSRGA